MSGGDFLDGLLIYAHYLSDLGKSKSARLLDR